MNNIGAPLRLWVVALLALAVGLVACRQQQTVSPTVIPATTAPTAAPDAATPPAPAADAWSAAQTRGRLVVGMSADYPPFASYTDEFELTGYDVALAQEIAGRLGLDVEIVDMAFDGLGGALQVGQIDAAISAISISEARREFVDFSSVYYVSEGAALARSDANLIVRSAADLTPYRVAVQSGSVYETWLQKAAVEAAAMPAANLLAYVNLNDAIGDLAEGLVDVVVADLPPLTVAARDNEALIVAGRGLNPQRFAVALPRGSNLLPRVNDALAALQSEGVLVELAERYLGLEAADVAPLPTPEPEPDRGAAAIPVTGCVDAMELVEHLSLDDDGMRSPPPISPGTAFQKGWRVRNSGTCTWGSGYTLSPVGGNVPQARMGGRATPLPGEVAPGATVDLMVDLVAPLEPGIYQGFWSMRSPGGLLFGERIWVGITVSAPATPTPPPTVPPSADISFAADRTVIQAGECVTLQWTTNNAAAVFLSAQGEPWQLNQVAASGSRAECPGATTTYELRVVATGAATDVRSIRVDVQQQPAANVPLITFFTVTPGFQITAGQCVDVRWQVEGEVSTIRVTRNEQVLWDGAPVRGTSRDCPPVGAMGYMVEATGPGGTARARQDVSVIEPPTPAPQATATAEPTRTPLPGDQPAVIHAFSVTPAQINVGQCVTVSWSAGGNIGRIQIKRNGLIVLDFAQFSDSLTDCLNTEGTYTYRIEAADLRGQLAIQQASVTVGLGAAGLIGGWRVATINGATVIPGTEMTIVFGDANNLSGSSGCNTFSAAYQVNGSSLSVGPLGATSQMCSTPPGVMEQEQLFRTVLSSATGFTVEGRQLSIRSARGQLTLESLAQPR